MAEAADTNLRGCPFCQAAPISLWVGNSTPGMEDCGYWAVECRPCGNGKPTRFVGVHGEDRRSAEARWNSRTSVSPARQNAICDACFTPKGCALFGCKNAAPSNVEAPQSSACREAGQNGDLRTATSVASTPSTTPQKAGELLTRDHDKSLKAAAQRLTLATGFQFDDCALDIQQVCQHALATPHVVAREHTVDIGEAHLKLGYIVVNGWPRFPSAEAAIDFIKARDLPLGWVVMELEQLSARPAKLFAAPQEGAGSTAGPATNGEPAAAAPVSMTPRTDALAAKFQNERNDDLSGAYGEALDLCEQLETALPAIERELPPKITDAMIRALAVGIDLHVRGPAPARDLGVLHERYQKVWDMVLKAAPTCAVSATAAKRHWVFAAAEACRVAVNGMDSSRSSKYECSEHLNYMLDQIRDGGFSPTKACRWLGWVQACLYCNGVMPLEEAKEINRVAARALAAFNSNTNRSV